MLKQFIVIIGLSIFIIFCMSYAQYAIQALIKVHDLVSRILMDVFSGGQAGNLARGLIALLSVPILISLIPTFFYWLIKKKWFPYFMEVIWVIWLIQVGALLMMYKTAGF